MPVDFQPIGSSGGGKPTGIDFQPIDFQPEAPPRHPSKMSDDEIALGLLKIDPAKWERVKKSRSYRDGAVRDLFTDPEGYWGSYVVGKNKDLPGSGVNRAVQSLFAGANKAKLAGSQLAGQLLSKATGGDYDTWNEIQVKANEINQNINQGRKPEEGGFDPANIAGQAVFGAGGSKGSAVGTSQKIGAAGLDAYVTTTGSSTDRAKAAGIAGGLTGVISKGSDKAQKLWEAAKARKALERVSKSKSPGEIMDQTSQGRFSADNVGEYAQVQSEDKLRAAFGEASNVYGPADQLAPTIESDLATYVPTLRDIVNKRKLGGIRPDEMPYFQNLLKNAEDSIANSQDVPRTLNELMDVYQEMSPMIRKQARGNGSRESLQALNAIRQAADVDIGRGSNVVRDSFQEGQAAYPDIVGPHKTPWLTALRDSDRPNDFFSALAQSKMSDKIPADLIKEAAIGTGADPIVYQFVNSAVKHSGDRPMGYVRSLEKTVPAAEAISPGMGETLADSISAAKLAQASGTALNWIGGGTTALLGAFNPAISGPGLAWKAIQSERGRALLTLLSKVPKGSPAEDAIKARIAALAVAQNYDQPDAVQ